MLSTVNVPLTHPNAHHFITFWNSNLDFSKPGFYHISGWYQQSNNDVQIDGKFNAVT